MKAIAIMFLLCFCYVPNWGVPRFDPERLTTLALLTLEDAADQDRRGPVKRTWGMRLALAWLHGSKLAEREDCEAFWEELVRIRTDQVNDTLANVCRAGDASRYLEGIYRSAGFVRTPEMMFLGAEGKRRKDNWTGRPPRDPAAPVRNLPPDL